MLSKKWVCYYRKADGKRSKSNLMVPKVSQPYKDAKTLLETVFRSRIGSIVSEEIALQVILMIGQEFDQFRFKIDQQKCERGTP